MRTDVSGTGAAPAGPLRSGRWMLVVAGVLALGGDAIYLAIVHSQGGDQPGNVAFFASVWAAAGFLLIVAATVGARPSVVLAVPAITALALTGLVAILSVGLLFVIGAALALAGVSARVRGRRGPRPPGDSPR